MPIPVRASLLGPLIAGCLAEWAGSPLTLPYLVFVGLGAIALIGLTIAPETGIRAPATHVEASGSSRSAKVLAPGATATLAAFAANGLFAGLSGLFLATCRRKFLPGLTFADIGI